MLPPILCFDGVVAGTAKRSEVGEVIIVADAVRDNMVSVDTHSTCTTSLAGMVVPFLTCGTLFLPLSPSIQRFFDTKPFPPNVGVAAAWRSWLALAVRSEAGSRAEPSRISRSAMATVESLTTFAARICRSLFGRAQIDTFIRAVILACLIAAYLAWLYVHLSATASACAVYAVALACMVRQFTRPRAVATSSGVAGLDRERLLADTADERSWHRGILSTKDYRQLWGAGVDARLSTDDQSVLAPVYYSIGMA